MRSPSTMALSPSPAVGNESGAVSVAEGRVERLGTSIAGAAPHARDVRARTRAIWWYGLGGLWVLDALLQAQPSMFTPDGLAGNVVVPTAQGQPDWITAPMLWGISVWQRNPAVWNGVAVLVELLIGCLLLAWRRWPSWGRAGLILSIGWGLVVWYFGEALGGLFAGSPTYLTGVPGSALLYVLLASALLLPEAMWASPHVLRMLQVGAGVLLGIGGLLQLAPLYWSPLGLASVLQSVAMMPLPFGLGALDAHLVASMASAPIVWNAALSAPLLLAAVALLLGRMNQGLCLLVLGWLLFVWVVFQGCGMIFSTMSTDPNTPLLWTLILVPSWIAARHQRREIHSFPAAPPESLVSPPCTE